MAHALDAMGWTKVFCDNRDNIPLPAVPLFFFDEPNIPHKPTWSSRELIPLVTSFGNQWKVPLGHTVLVANSKSEWYARINEGGRPVVNKMAEHLVRDIVSLAQQELADKKESSDEHSSSSDLQSCVNEPVQ